MAPCHICVYERVHEQMSKRDRERLSMTASLADGYKMNFPEHFPAFEGNERKYMTFSYIMASFD